MFICSSSFYRLLIWFSLDDFSAASFWIKLLLYFFCFESNGLVYLTVITRSCFDIFALGHLLSIKCSKIFCVNLILLDWFIFGLLFCVIFVRKVKWKNFKFMRSIENRIFYILLSLFLFSFLVSFYFIMFLVYLTSQQEICEFIERSGFHHF